MQNNDIVAGFDDEKDESLKIKLQRLLHLIARKLTNKKLPEIFSGSFRYQPYRSSSHTLAVIL